MLNNGQILGKNTIVKEIGSGNFGHVFSTKNDEHTDLIALKVCKLPINDIEDKLRFIQENKILHNLKVHPKVILPLSEMCEDSPYFYYTMELADSNLDEYLNRSYTGDFQDRLNLFKRICEGLHHAHSKSVVHRDLWWNNVLIKKENGDIEVKLNDFGRAKDFTLNDISSKTPCWGAQFVVPPELFFGVWDEKNPKLENYIRGDLYALGILFYYILIAYPSMYHIEIRGSIENFKRKYSLDLTSLNHTDRLLHYNKWVEEQKQATPFTGLNFSLPDADLTNKVSAIIQRLCNNDYSSRYQDVKELITDLNKL